MSWAGLLLLFVVSGGLLWFQVWADFLSGLVSWGFQLFLVACLAFYRADLFLLASAGFSWPELVSTCLGFFLLAWAGFLWPGLVSVGLGWFRLAWGDFSWPALVSVGLGWFQVAWSGFS